jgi:hypothetical protein
MGSEKKARLTRYIIGLLAVASIANSIWMISTPLVWYQRVPAAVPDFGPYNEHMVRDIGCAYGVIGVALAVAVWNASLRLPLAIVGAAFYVLHALIHVFDTARGVVPPLHWLIDLPTTYLPAILLVAITPFIKQKRTTIANFPRR